MVCLYAAGDLWVCTDTYFDEDPLEVVEVFPTRWGAEIDSRTGLPWGMSQKEFDEDQATWKNRKMLLRKKIDEDQAAWKNWKIQMLLWKKRLTK